MALIEHRHPDHFGLQRNVDARPSAGKPGVRRAHRRDVEHPRVGEEAGGGSLRRFLAEEAPRIRARMARLPQGQVASLHILALSGGADDGAFGAGLLTGWTARGNRPQFSVVTGVSAGALIAPFAFLGPEYDPQL